MGDDCNIDHNKGKGIDREWTGMVGGTGGRSLDRVMFWSAHCKRVLCALGVDTDCLNSLHK